MRCGTHTMFRVLKERYGGYHDKSDSYHGRIVPAGCKRYFRFAISRNPYSRMVSLWRVTRGQRYRSSCAPGLDKFIDFAGWMATKGSRRWSNLVKPQHVWLDGIPLDDVLKLEALNTEVRRLPFWEGPDHLEPAPNRTCVGQPPWQSYYDNPEIAEAARAWAGEDFERYGYPLTIQ